MVAIVLQMERCSQILATYRLLDRKIEFFHPPAILSADSHTESDRLK